MHVFYVGMAAKWNAALECHVCSTEAYDRNSNQTPHGEHVGWYWVSGLPGCLWDGEASGPFATDAAALADAQEVA